MTVNRRNPHIGSSLDALLEEDGALAAARAVAVKRVFAFQMREAMKRQGITNSEMASRMRTSRAALDRLLDPENKSVTLLSMSRAAAALGQDLRVEFVEFTGPGPHEATRVSA
jgi:hypothetical protein